MMSNNQKNDPNEVDNQPESARPKPIEPQISAHRPEKQTEMSENASQTIMDALFQEAHVRQDCPSPDMILEYDSGYLPQVAAQKLASHFLGCQDCQKELKQLRNLSEADVQHSTALNWLDKLIAEGKNVLRALQTPMLTPQFALRGDSSSGRMIFESAPYKLFFTIQQMPEEPTRFHIEGQLLQENELLDLSTTPIQLYLGNSLTSVAEGDQFGLFSFESIATGQYGLNLELPHHSLIIEHFAIP